MKTLNIQHEKPFIIGRTSKIAFLFNYLIAIICIGIIFYAYTTKTAENAISVNVAIFIFGLIAAVSLIYAEIRVMMKKMIIFKSRAIVEEGILKKNSVTISYPNISELTLEQSVLGRLLNYGDLSIRTAGARHKELLIEKLGSPAKIKRIVEHLIFIQKHPQHPAHPGHTAHSHHR